MESSIINQGVLELKRIFPERASLDDTETGPEPRSKHTMALSPDGKLCIFGGVGESTNAARRVMDRYPLYRELWIYDTKKENSNEDPWTDFDQPNAFIGSTSTFHDGELIICGGVTENDDVSDELMRVNTQQMMVQIDDGPEVSCHGMVKIGSDLYIFGGFDEDLMLSWKMIKYNLDTNETTILTDDPLGPPETTDPGLANYGGEIFLIGGETFTGLLEEVWVYNIASNSWDVCQTLPDPQHGYPRFRRAHSVVTWGKFAFILGGVGVGDVILDDIWLFNMNLRHWMRLNIKLRRPVYSHASCISEDGTCYVFGGVLSGIEDPFIRSRALYKINLVHHALYRAMTLHPLNVPGVIPIRISEGKYTENKKKRAIATQSFSLPKETPAVASTNLCL